MNYLVDCRGNFSSGKQDFKLLAREVADSYGLGEAKVLTFLHGFPNRLEIHEKKVLFFNRIIKFSRLHTHRIMNQIQIKEIQSKIPTYMDIYKLTCLSRRINIKHLPF